MLDAAVAAGELPPVEDRLPVDPIVIEPYESIGSHGGTASAFEGGDAPELICRFHLLRATTRWGCTSIRMSV
jgi:peptide/nickel transport system substrate-binding protein